MAVPSFILLSGNEFKPAVVDGINTKVIPITLTAYNTTILIIGVEVVNVVKLNVPNVNKVNPVIANVRAPNLSNKIPEIGLINPINKAPGRSIKPEWNADSPRTIWM